jgi:DNA-binding transcriptional MerR regulator
MSKGREGLMTRGEASAFLGITPSTLRYWKQKGAIRPRYKEARGRRCEYYDPVELAAFKEAHEHAANPRELQLLLAQTYAVSQTTKRRVDALEALLGVTSHPLSTKPQDIQDLWEEACRDCRRVINGKEKVSYWADKLFGVTDVYLELVAKTVRVKEPWKPFLELSRQLRLHQDWDATYIDPNVHIAYYRLHSACAFLNANVYAYCVRVFGLKKAITELPKDFRNEHFDIMMHATEPLH